MKTVHIYLKTDTETEVLVVLGDDGYLSIEPAKGRSFVIQHALRNSTPSATHACLLALANTLRAKWDREDRVGLPTEWLDEDQIIEAIRMAVGTMLVSQCGYPSTRSKGARAGRSLLGSVISDINVRVYGEEAVTL